MDRHLDLVWMVYRGRGGVCGVDMLFGAEGAMPAVFLPLVTKGAVVGLLGEVAN